MTYNFVMQHVSLLNGINNFPFLAGIGSREHCYGFVHVGIKICSSFCVYDLDTVLLQVYYEFVVDEFNAFLYR